MLGPIDGEAGVDEAGCGSLIGDLVAAAVILPSGFDIDGVCDSKKISEKKRSLIAERIMREATVGIGIVTLEEINSHPFAFARRQVFQRALENLALKAVPSSIIVDGTQFFDGFRDIPFECVARADAQYASVAAASIVAKTHRDAQIHALCDAAPELATRFSWRSNKGYPTAAHLVALKEGTVSRYHRTSFGPCQGA